MTFDDAFVGMQLSGSAVIPGTNVPVTFGGNRNVTVQPGGDAWSDAVALPFYRAGDAVAFTGRKLAVSFHIAGDSGPMTWHAKALTTSYVSLPGSGSKGADESERAFPASTTSWFFLDAVDMQVTPAAGRYIAKTYNVRFDQKRLLHDNVYNVQMGAAELGGNIEAYRGSYILAFAAYNAGRGRVQEWIERFGDPRDANVDPVDWVERIPFSETRNYVQRIMENVQAYRVRFGRGTKLLIEADIRRGSAVN